MAGQTIIEAHGLCKTHHTGSLRVEALRGEHDKDGRITMTPDHTTPVCGQPMTARSPRRTDRRMRVLLTVVLANYAAQVPYDLHLYEGTFNARGIALLVMTLGWFLAGYGGLGRRSRLGYGLMVAFLALEFAFYFHNEILLIPQGYGLPYHLVHGADPLLWVVFLIGDINFFTAGYFLWYLWRRGP